MAKYLMELKYVVRKGENPQGINLMVDISVARSKHHKDMCTVNDND